MPGVDIVSHDVYAEGVPHGGYDRLRREAPVAWINETAANGHTGRGFWAVTRWDELVAVHKDWRTYSSEVGGTEIEELAPDAIEARKTMLETDPPRHTRLRQLVNPAFSKSMVATYSDAATRLVESVLDEALAQPELDAVEHIARALPIRMLTGILGVPDDDAEQLFHWADQIVYHADPDYSAAVVDAVDTDPYRLLPFRSPVSERVFDYVARIIAARGRHPAGDVISVLADAAVDGEPLSARERGTFFLLLLIAGNETTRHSLSHALIAFAERPGRARAAARRPDVARSRRSRRCSAGRVRRSTSAAPRRPTRNSPACRSRLATRSSPGTWRPTSTRRSSPIRTGSTSAAHPTVTSRSAAAARISASGNGWHAWRSACFLEALVRRVDQLELAGPVERVRSNFINGVKRLPIAWQAR